MIEDAAAAVGATYGGRHAGTFGNLEVLSCNVNKIMTPSGGGVLLADDEQVAERTRFLATQIRDPASHCEHSTIGYNYRLSNRLAAVGRGQLARPTRWSPVEGRSTGSTASASATSRASRSSRWTSASPTAG